MEETLKATKEYTIDATNQKLGRLSSEIAVLLMGKRLPDYAPNKVLDVLVKIQNASKLDVSVQKMNEKEHVHYTGFHGGQRRIPLKRVVEKKGYGEIIRHAVKGMLPKNKLQSKRLALLVIEE